MINKLRVVEKEKEQLEGKKLEAEAYMAKQAECTIQRLMGHKINGFKAQVGECGRWGGGGAWAGLPEAPLQQQAPAAGLHACSRRVHEAAVRQAPTTAATPSRPAGHDPGDGRQDERGDGQAAARAREVQEV
jgi:hypothetical protein